MGDENVIGCWIPEKKRQKFNWSEFESTCEKEGFILKLIDIKRDLESQGPICIFLHKLTDILSHAESGDQNAKATVTKIQGYIQRHPELIVIDALENVKTLRERHKSYQIIQDRMLLNDVFTPNFVDIETKDTLKIMALLKMKNVKFPFLSKPLVAHGSSDAHKMMVIFNEEGLQDCQPPCVAQDFINHNAILYKVFIVGEHFYIVERPSLKNFYPKDCVASSTIFFNSHNISASGSNSKWSVISEEDIPLTVKLNVDVIERIAQRIRKIFDLVLVGVDVVIENHTGKYAIIDINAYPGYDGYPHLFQDLASTFKKMITQKRSKHSARGSTLKKCLSDDLDSGFESDEKKKQFCN